ncbi:MAG TPA: glycosyl hydrolase [Candidatus Acidoferrales bacterium]|nr:glycosyl hydrolase [Candidatus Acidoferrales bacterium]
MRRIVGLALAVSILVSSLMVAAVLFLQTPISKPKISPDSVGICVHSLSQADAEHIACTGARWIRIDISNNETDLMNSLTNANARNLSVLGILGSWMFNKSCSFTLNEWSNAVTSNVSKYAQYVDAWEIWNEPTSPTYPLLNLNLTNSEKQQNMATIVDFYYAMAQTAYPIISNYDPNATIVLFGGLNLYSGGDPNVALDKDFALQLASRNITQYGDAIAIHAYPWGNEMNELSKASYIDSLEFYQTLFPNKPIWVTETGQKITANCSEKMQADYLSFAFNFFNGETENVFWYAFYDDPTGNFGLVVENNYRLAFAEMSYALNH